MIIEAFILSVLIGLIRGGKLSNLNRMPLRYPNLFALPLIFFIGSYAIGLLGGDGSHIYVRVLNLIHYVTLLGVLALNIHIRAMWLAIAGTFSNFLVLAMNHGVMPMSVKALKIAGMEKYLDPGLNMIRHSIMSPETRLKPLADIIGVTGPSFLPKPIAMQFSQIISIGDILIAIAILILIQQYMCMPWEANSIEVQHVSETLNQTTGT